MSQFIFLNFNKKNRSYTQTIDQTTTAYTTRIFSTALRRRQTVFRRLYL